MPFKDVYIHGLVRDENGKKMSKSANNGIDPLLLINKYGTDALRYTLIREVAGAGQDISLQYNRATDESESVEASRNFANKLWNAARFVMMNLEGKSPEQLGKPDLNQLELCDRWILSRLNQVIVQTKENIENYGLGEAAKGLYEFIWGDFCDWYIELVKTRLWKDGSDPSRLVAQQTLAAVLENIIKLLHPFMPHITEELWQTLSQQNDDFLALQSYPTVNQAYIDLSLEQSFTLIFETIRTVRNLRAEADIKPGIKVPVIFQSESETERITLESGQVYLQDLAKIESLTITEELAQESRQCIAGVVGTIQVLSPLSGLVDLANLQAKLAKNLGKIENEAKSLESRLNNPGFVNKAPEAVIEGARAALAESQKQAEILQERLQRLQ
jgi:valyl-tRNA synthetase